MSILDFHAKVMTMSKRKFRHLSLPPAGLLRPQLDNLLSNAQADPEKTLAQASALSSNVTADLFMATLLRSFAAAPIDVQVALTPHLPAWVHSTGRYDAVQKIATERREEIAVINTARTWLEMSGVDISAFAPVQQGLIFDSAFRHGNDVQASYHAFWYTDHRRNRMLLLAFLTDIDLPWEGATKDVFLQPERSPDAIRRKTEARVAADFFASGKITDISGGAYKYAMLSALTQNRKQKISLPAGLISLRDFFAQNVLTLPNAPNMPHFTLDDFDALARTGQNVEALRRHEQQFGKRVRMPDGKELRVINPGFDE